MMPASYFIDDGTFITRNRAFANFTFSALLLLDQDPGTPPQSLIDCIAHGTVPIIVGKHHKLDYTRYFSFAMAKFRDFGIEQAISFMLTAPADALYVYANSVKIVQEFFYMRPYRNMSYGGVHTWGLSKGTKRSSAYKHWLQKNIKQEFLKINDLMISI